MPLGHHCSGLSLELGLGKAQGPWVLIRHYGMTAPFACPSDLSALCRNVMSSQEVVDFIQSKITQKDENGVLRPLSSIVEEVRSRASPSLRHAVFLHPSSVPDCPPSPSDWFVQHLGYAAAHGLQRWLEQEQRRL